MTSIFDADIADWATVLAYVIVSLLSAHAAVYAGRRRQTRERVFWQVTAALLIFFGINELLDLQTFLSSAARAHAKAYGWYEQRRAVQYGFVLILAATAVSAGMAMLWLTRRASGAVRAALGGLIFIGTFILLRAASFHHLDEFFDRGAPAFNYGSLQETAGVLMIAGAAIFYLRKPRSRS